MMLTQAQYTRETASSVGPYRPGRSPCLPPVTRHAPGQFVPDRRYAWAIRLVVAVLATAALGIGIPRATMMLARVLIPGFSEPPLPLWVKVVAGLWYAALIVFAYFPYFLAVSAWTLKRGTPAGSRQPLSRRPSVSILIPAHNEQEIVLETIRSALGQDYPDVEVIVIDDGSTDRTPELVATTAARLIRHETNRGKAAALNTGLRVARGEVIVTCDADSYFEPDAIRHLVAPLADPRNGGVAGQLQLLRTDSAIRAFQAMEYSFSQVLSKRAQDAIGRSVLVAPGPVSAYRADVLRAVGGVPDDTLTEDVDLTWTVIRHGLRMAYEPRAVAHTDAPRTDAELRRQRHRWIRGGIQSLRKHKSIIGSRSLGLIGLFWMPIWLLGYLMHVASFAVALVGALLIWVAGTPNGYLAFLGLGAMVAAAIDAAMIVSGLVASGWRELRLAVHLPAYLVYKAVRIGWFTLEACCLELRRAPRSWDGVVSNIDTLAWGATAGDPDAGQAAISD
jgi:cellulose synthase/poly-beta-1,6-N-acetylglucosamine synthase-like glycosyltransferase